MEADLAVRPFTAAEVYYHRLWLPELVGAEFARLARVIEAPTCLLEQPDWLAWEVRCWALVIVLARIGQLYAALERREGSGPAQRVLYEAALVCLCPSSS